MFGLSEDEVDHEGGWLSVSHQLKRIRGKFVFAPPKGGKVRDVPLPPIPILRGRAGTTLQAQDDVRVLSRRRKEERIPLQAVRRVGAEGRALAVELTLPAGTTPVT
ncbi:MULTISPECIES: hypothetical protein [unclassified Streptomyces]|uniref:hypothetical protein n=1 Tax=unclassified Streptomyces TaxID=2593676 RepID=UPI0018FE8152|nr:MULTISPECIES: hypothetical protein [unclassified Streptomyces]